MKFVTGIDMRRETLVVNLFLVGLHTHLFWHNHPVFLSAFI